MKTGTLFKTVNIFTEEQKLLYDSITTLSDNLTLFYSTIDVTNMGMLTNASLISPSSILDKDLQRLDDIDISLITSALIKNGLIDPINQEIDRLKTILNLLKFNELNISGFVIYMNLTTLNSHSCKYNVVFLLDEPRESLFKIKKSEIDHLVAKNWMFDIKTISTKEYNDTKIHYLSASEFGYDLNTHMLTFIKEEIPTDPIIPIEVPVGEVIIP